MNKIWFIWIDGKNEGPKSYEDLKLDPRLTPDTLIWKKGFKNWKKIREVDELKKLFEDNHQSGKSEPTSDGEKKNELHDEIAIDMREEPPYFLWILFALICLIYVLVQLYR